MGTVFVVRPSRSHSPCFTMSSRPSSMPARPVGERSQISAEDLKNHTPLKKAETKENTKLPDSDEIARENLAVNQEANPASEKLKEEIEAKANSKDLRKVITEEKNILPTKEDIEAEKKADA